MNALHHTDVSQLSCSCLSHSLMKSLMLFTLIFFFKFLYFTLSFFLMQMWVTFSHIITCSTCKTYTIHMLKQPTHKKTTVLVFAERGICNFNLNHICMCVYVYVCDWTRHSNPWDNNRSRGRAVCTYYITRCHKSMAPVTFMSVACDLGW